MLLRRALLESELVAHQLHYDKVFATSQVVSETERRAMECVLDSILFEIQDIRKELDLIKANEKQ